MGGRWEQKGADARAGRGGGGGGGPRMSEREVSQIHARVTKSILAKDCACDQIRKV